MDEFEVILFAIFRSLFENSFKDFYFDVLTFFSLNVFDLKIFSALYSNKKVLNLPMDIQSLVICNCI